MLRARDLLSPMLSGRAGGNWLFATVWHELIRQQAALPVDVAAVSVNRRTDCSFATAWIRTE